MEMSSVALGIMTLQIFFVTGIHKMIRKKSLDPILYIIYAVIAQPYVFYLQHYKMNPELFIGFAKKKKMEAA
jgi:TM2 domain-containing membrane protein YozV